MSISLDKLTAEAIALVGRIGAHARDEAEQHVAQIDKLKARVLQAEKWNQDLTSALNEDRARIEVLVRELAMVRRELAEVNTVPSSSLPVTASALGQDLYGALELAAKRQDRITLLERELAAKTMEVAALRQELAEASSKVTP